MTHPLTALREKYRNHEARIKALQDANQARRAEAQHVRAEVESAAMLNNVEAMRARMDDLQALDAAFRQNQTMQAESQLALHEMTDEIAQLYQRAKGGFPPVDWSVAVDWQQKALCSQWGGTSYRDGKVCLIDVELCAPELEALGTIMSRRVTQEGNRLRVMENEYQGVCWRDLSGEQIVRLVAPLLDKSRSPLLEVSTQLESLAVLA